VSADISRAIASSIDLDQTLRLVAQNLARLVDASLCQIALYEEDARAGSAPPPPTRKTSGAGSTASALSPRSCSRFSTMASPS